MHHQNDNACDRHTRAWKCQPSVGELYRWILAKLSDKDIKRALHKYRDLMPRQSDWNRKLTQATSVPELGFRFLYRCGQIDENTHRTMQKMLRYIDRQDVLPYFDTILYNSNMANHSLATLQQDKVALFIKLTTPNDEEIHPDPPYEIIENRLSTECSRITRAQTKRQSDPIIACSIKRSRRSLSSSGDDDSQQEDVDRLVSQLCRASQSRLTAQSLVGPVTQCFLSTSLQRMAADLEHLLYCHQPGTSLLRSSNPPSTLRRAIHTLRLLGQSTLSIALHEAGEAIARRRQGDDNARERPAREAFDTLTLAAAGQAAPDQPSSSQQFNHSLLKQLITPGGGVGASGLASGSVQLFYYCTVKLRISVDRGPLLRPTPVNAEAEFDDPLQRQMMRFLSATDILCQPNTDYVCEIRFNQLSHLESFWRDYRSGVLRKTINTLLHPDNSLSPLAYVGSDYNIRSSPWLLTGASMVIRDPRLQASIQAALISLSDPFAAVRSGDLSSSRYHVWPLNTSINLFVSKRDYQNGRLLLMRNLRHLPNPGESTCFTD